MVSLPNKTWPSAAMARVGSRPRSHPCARAEERSGMGGARASRASITDSLHLFEVNERSEWCELCNAPMTRASPQVAPDAAGRRGRGNRGRLLLLPFLGETRKGSRLRGRNPRLRPLQENLGSIEPLCLHDVPGRGARPRTATYLLLSRQENVGQEKATPVPASPAACGVRGNLRCSRHGRIAQLAPLTAFVHLEQVQ